VRRSEGDDPSLAASDAELQARIAHALSAAGGLDDEQRAVVVLRDIEGFDYRQIAAILDIPPGTVKSRLHRARMALREAIAPVRTPKPGGP
jgi:RNA polymerase sigma-70 factor (ECF subfamily)